MVSTEGRCEIFNDKGGIRHFFIILLYYFFLILCICILRLYTTITYDSLYLRLYTLL